MEKSFPVVQKTIFYIAEVTVIYREFITVIRLSGEGSMVTEHVVRIGKSLHDMGASFYYADILVKV